MIFGRANQIDIPSGYYGHESFLWGTYAFYVRPGFQKKDAIQAKSIGHNSAGWSVELADYYLSPSIRAAVHMWNESYRELMPLYDFLISTFPDGVNYWTDTE